MMDQKTNTYIKFLNFRVNVVTQGQLARSFPMNNLNHMDMPKLADVPKNNYDDRGQEKVNENARIAVNKKRILDEAKSRNLGNGTKAPGSSRKTSDLVKFDHRDGANPTTDGAGVSNLQMLGNTTWTHFSEMNSKPHKSHRANKDNCIGFQNQDLKNIQKPEEYETVVKLRHLPQKPNKQMSKQ